MKEQYTLYTSIKKELKKRLLFRAISFGFLGGAILLVTGTFLPLESMQKWGWVLFLFSFLCIGWGFFPYQKIKQKENHPDQIVYSEEGIAFHSYKKKEIYILKKNIKKMEFIQKKDLYGIGVWTKKNNTIPNFFFPYFNEKAFSLLRDACL